MSHLFCLLFEYHRYKKDAILRVYADDLLVEEILLTKDIPVRLKKIRARPPFVDPDDNTWSLTFPEKLFVFEIDQNNLKKSIRIEVINNDNNYTNGFMNKFSYIKFYSLLLVPRCLLHEGNWIKLARFVKKTWNKKWTKEMAELAHSDYNFFPYRGPRYEDVIIESESNPWKGEFLWNPRGGSFTVEIPLFRKYGQIHITKPIPGRMYLYPMALRILSLFGLLNTSK